jgi:hypothetical protein
MTYDDTNNPGGVYILAVCEVGATSDSQCKFDAFKVRDTSCTANCGPGTVDNLTVGKSAFPTFTRTYAWDVAKSRTTAATVRLNSPGPATVSYRVTATWSGPVDSGWAVGGEITVTNGNVGDAYDLTVADAVNDANATCVVTGGESQTLAGKSQVVLPYTCTYSAAPAANAETNTATIEWNAILSDGSQTSGDAAHVDVDFTFNAATTGNPTVVNGCVTLTDTFNAVATTLGLACVNGTWTKDAGNALASFAESYTSPTFTLTYNRSIAVPANACAVYNNTAAITGLTDPTPLDDSASVTVCPRVNGLTIGFWSNKNGQARITGGAWTLVSGVNVCNVGTFLRSYAPFQALPANATCTAVAAYVYNVIKGGGTNCASTTCIAMLKAQMLATALNVFFLTTNGNELIDLVHGCKMIDSSGGTATCNGGESWSPAFDNQATKTVLQMLSWAASQYTDSTHWYGTSKPLQVLAKDAFDAINNGVALSA